MSTRTFPCRKIPSVGVGHHAFPRYFLLHHRAEHGAAKAMYKDDWESLVGLCDEFLYLGGTEKGNPQICFGTAGEGDHLHHQL